ncbi:hypothetical protein QAD02_011069 [Eretmocerus hayati]|uniref:Uncharacterized protein n=1 Tax=Eretmocerus hayati TaxID=131215 RepID=A0ACC2NWP1_9HYME|nr:hypothetical protein QAD02_011069 [Eretmocerus hayati]
MEQATLLLGGAEDSLKFCEVGSTVDQLWVKSQRLLSHEGSMQLAPEAILNDQIKTECVKRLKSVHMTKKTKDKVSEAAVLVPLCTYNGKLGLLYTLRSNKVRANRGQVSFPGGMKDEKDKTLEDTALRETWEELNIARDTVEVWGSGNLIYRKNVTVMPVLGFVGKVDPKSLKVNAQEVQEAFFHPLEKLCDPALCRYTQFRDNYTLPTYLGGEHKIWGLTAVITHLVMSALVPDTYKHKLVYLKPIETKSPITSKAQAS